MPSPSPGSPGGIVGLLAAVALLNPRPQDIAADCSSALLSVRFCLIAFLTGYQSIAVNCTRTRESMKLHAVLHLEDPCSPSPSPAGPGCARIIAPALAPASDFK